MRYILFIYARDERHGCHSSIDGTFDTIMELKDRLLKRPIRVNCFMSDAIDIYDMKTKTGKTISLTTYKNITEVAKDVSDVISEIDKVFRD